MEALMTSQAIFRGESAGRDSQLNVDGRKGQEAGHDHLWYTVAVPRQLWDLPRVPAHASALRPSQRPRSYFSRTISSGRAATHSSITAPREGGSLVGAAGGLELGARVLAHDAARNGERDGDERPDQQDDNNRAKG